MKLNFGNKITLIKWFSPLILSLILLILLKKKLDTTHLIYTPWKDRSRIVDEIDKEEAFVPFLKDLIIYIIVGIFRIIQR